MGGGRKGGGGMEICLHGGLQEQREEMRIASEGVGVSL